MAVIWQSSTDNHQLITINNPTRCNMLWLMRYNDKGTSCRLIKFFPSETPEGETTFKQLKHLMWEVLIEERQSSAVLKTRLTFNEAKQLTFKILYPDSYRHPTVRNPHGREVINYNLPAQPVKVEPELFHTIKSFRQKLLSLGGPRLVCEVMGAYYAYSPLSADMETQ